MIWSKYFVFATRRLLQIFPKTMMKLAHHRQLIYTGAATSCAAGFFAKSSDSKKDADIEMMAKITEADSYYGYYMIDNAYSILRRYRKSNDPEMLWRLARVMCEQGKLCRNPEERTRLFEEALEIAERALAGEGGSTCFGAHKWYAIILNYASECQGTKAQLTKAYDVKTHLERALEINPTDATTWMILGMWHFAFADMPTYTRWAAKAIYATPPSSTYEEAMHHFVRAETIQPGFCSSNIFYIAQIHEKLGRKDEAIELYKKTFAMPVVSVDDNNMHERAYQKLKKLGIDLQKEESTEQ